MKAEKEELMVEHQKLEARNNNIHNDNNDNDNNDIVIITSIIISSNNTNHDNNYKQTKYLNNIHNRNNHDVKSFQSANPGDGERFLLLDRMATARSLDVVKGSFPVVINYPSNLLIVLSMFLFRHITNRRRQ